MISLDAAILRIVPSSPFSLPGILGIASAKIQNETMPNNTLSS